MCPEVFSSILLVDATMFVYPDTPNDLHNAQQQLHVTTDIFPDALYNSKQNVHYNLT